MTLRARALLPAVALAAMATVAVAGCQSSGPATASGPSASPVMSVTPTHPVTVYFAEGGDMNGTAMHASACASGCPLSGDGTTSLWNMTWPTWNPVEAVGTGTEKIDGCNPSCATGKLYPVQVTVTFRNPVMVCLDRKTARYYWTRASFSWPAGLPAAFSGENAPVNPVKYANIAAESTSSCTFPTATDQ